jgi:S1-C subfamily serine protease
VGKYPFAEVETNYSLQIDGRTITIEWLKPTELYEPRGGSYINRAKGGDMDHSSKLRTVLVIGIAAVVVGCATSSSMYLANNGGIIRCSSSGAGLFGMAAQASSHNKCAQDVQSLGALPLEEAGVIGILFSSADASILRIIPGSPADRIGMKPGDRILEVDERPVLTGRDAQILMFGRLGTPVNIRYKAADGEKLVTLTRASARYLLTTNGTN